MDVSLHFKACVETAALSNILIDNPGQIFGAKNNKRSLFCIKTKKITNQIAKLYTLLVENRQSYLNFCKYLSIQGHMEDIDRDEIDSVAQNIIGVCSGLVSELRSEIAKYNVSQQNEEHRKITIYLIEEYLKQVCKIYSEQKAIRVKNIIDLRKLSKLDTVLYQKDTIIKDYKAKSNIASISEINEYVNEADSLTIQEINGDTNAILCNEEEQLSPEDIQMFEAENEQLYDELTTLTEEIKQIERNVVHITELQEFFTERVLDQNKNLDHVLTTVVGSTENVKEANEQIRKAIQRNAGLRVCVLFFLLVMSFTLIFLDWYNP